MVDGTNREPVSSRIGSVNLVKGLGSDGPMVAILLELELMIAKLASYIIGKLGVAPGIHLLGVKIPARTLIWKPILMKKTLGNTLVKLQVYRRNQELQPGRRYNWRLAEIENPPARQAGQVPVQGQENVDDSDMDSASKAGEDVDADDAAVLNN